LAQPVIRLADHRDIANLRQLSEHASLLGVRYDGQRARRPEIVYCQYTG